MTLRDVAKACAAGALAVLAAASSPAAEVWKWTDAQGVTHYGSAPPDDARLKAERIDLPDTRVSESDQKAAQWRVAREKAEADRAAAEASRTPPAGPRAGASAPASSCEQQRKRYDESVACFARYRYGRGLVRPDAYQHCTEVPQPDDACR